MLKTRRIYWIYIGVFFLVVTLIPIGVNKLMNMTPPEIFANKGVVRSNDWIGFMGSFLGSLLAGILTLGGVYLTIREQRIESIVDKFPSRLRNLDIINDLFKDVKYRDIKVNYDEGLYGIVYDSIIEICSKKDILIYNSTEINGYFYIHIKKLTRLSEEFCIKYPRQNSNPIYRGMSDDERNDYREEGYKAFINKFNQWLIDFDKMYYDFLNEHEKIIDRKRIL